METLHMLTLQIKRFFVLALIINLYIPINAKKSNVSFDSGQESKKIKKDTLSKNVGNNQSGLQDEELLQEDSD